VTTLQFMSDNPVLTVILVILLGWLLDSCVKSIAYGIGGKRKEVDKT